MSLTAVALSGITGCSIFSKDKDSKKSSWSWFKKDYQEPKSLVAIWTEDKLAMPGKPITRGFGGRIYFYNDRSQAVPVDGELVVYGFDDSGRMSGSLVKQEADRKFRFTPEQFTTHFSQNDLGASYSIWLPWDADGGPNSEVTLFPTFITKSGKLIRGESAKVMLSGPTHHTNTPPEPLQVGLPQQQRAPSILGNNPPVNQVQTASAVVPTNTDTSLPDFGAMQPGTTSGDTRRRTTTITVPNSSGLKNRR